MRFQEIKDIKTTKNKLIIYDIDDTLVHTPTRVKVRRDGQVVGDLDSHEFTLYKLRPGEEFDFENFRNAREFFKNSQPIPGMIWQLRRDIREGNAVHMVTARADFDNKKVFLKTFKRWGVDMNKVHVHRAGNMPGGDIHEKKKTIIRNLLDRGNYAKAIMYDDSKPNLQSFMELKTEYPGISFFARHVAKSGEESELARAKE
jgi:hypothetical protein